MSGCGGPVVGIDWATEAHVVCVVDSNARRVVERSFKNTAEGLSAFVEFLRLQERDIGEQLKIGIESPSVLVTEVLVERGFEVYSINPKQSDRFRDRYSVAGAKDDRRDALVIARALQTDPESFRRVLSHSPATIRIRESLRAWEDVTEDRVRTAAKLREVLIRFLPDFVFLVKNFDRDWILAICERVAAKGPENVKTAEVQRILRKHRSRAVARDIVTALRANPGANPVTVQSLRNRSKHLIERLQLLTSQARQQEKELAQLLRSGAEGSEERRCVDILLSCPGVGDIVAATFLAEAPELIAKGMYEVLRQLAGVAPVTIASGKQNRVVQRRSCNQRLRNAVFHWARVAAQHDETCKAYVQKLKDAGRSFGRQMRGLGDRLLHGFCAAVRKSELFDPVRFQCRATAQTADRARRPAEPHEEQKVLIATSPAPTSAGRLGAEELRMARNDVPVQEVLASIRPHQSSRPGKLTCPQCGKAEAKVKIGTNLLRCFACKKNWNPLDLLMAFAGMPFRQAAEHLLQTLRAAPSPVVGTPLWFPPGAGHGAVPRPGGTP